METTAAPAPALTPDIKARCSDLARQASLSPVATIGTYDGYLLVEIALPWPRDVAETAEAAVLAPLIGPLGWRLQAVVPAERAPDPVERRVILHVRRLGEAGFGGYRRLETTVGESLEDAVRTLITAAGDEAPCELDAAGVDLLLCTHGTRDSCCGRYGASLGAQLAAAGPRPGVNMWRTSHTGGHRFAPTFLVLPEGTSWGFADVDVLERVLGRRGDFADVVGHYRGCTGLGGPQEQTLEAEVLRRVGWHLLDRPRRGSFDGTRAELSWQENDTTVTWVGDIGGGRVVSLPGCQQPPSAGMKPETEWAVTAVQLKAPNKAGGTR
jgi:hypothetical protein